MIHRISRKPARPLMAPETPLSEARRSLSDALDSVTRHRSTLARRFALNWRKKLFFVASALESGLGEGGGSSPVGWESIGVRHNWSIRSVFFRVGKAFDERGLQGAAAPPPLAPGGRVHADWHESCLAPPGGGVALPIRSTAPCPHPFPGLAFVSPPPWEIEALK